MVKHTTAPILIALSLGCSAQDRHESATPSSAAQKPNRPTTYRAMVYSAAFREKYALPAGGVQKLDDGLQALVLRIVRQPDDHPTCYLDFYVDDTLDLVFPEGSEGVLGRPDYENPYFFVQDGTLIGAQNHRWDARTGNFHEVACQTEPKNCLVQESGPSAYVRRLMPGIALQTYSLMCGALDPKYGPTEMWLLRNGRDVKELSAPSGDETATYRFAMPAALFTHAAPRIREAIKVYEDIPIGPERRDLQFTVPGGS